jgi:cleavage and polyadenylation specificity factor subunit 6/7
VPPGYPPPLQHGLSELEFEEIMSRNRTVSSSAIARAVQDAANNEFASAIETLVTAISLIKQSKVANDDRCKILVSSLQDTLTGIENKSYSSRRERSRSRERAYRASHRSYSREHEYRPREYRERSRERDRDYYRERDREREYYEERQRYKERERMERERERESGPRIRSEGDMERDMRGGDRADMRGGDRADMRGGERMDMRGGERDKERDRQRH